MLPYDLKKHIVLAACALAQRERDPDRQYGALMMREELVMREDEEAKEEQRWEADAEVEAEMEAEREAGDRSADLFERSPVQQSCKTWFYRPDTGVNAVRSHRQGSRRAVRLGR